MSFALNVLALSLPFMDLRRGLSTEPYSLQASVRFLWESKLYVLAGVVVAFSMVFPFLKLAVMTLVLFGGVRETREQRTLELVERYGKWSMLDVFLVCIMLALANDQFWIDAAPRMGLICFTLAIVTSMLTSRHMLVRLGRGERGPVVELSHPRWLALGQALLLSLLVAVLLVPFLEISDWLLKDRPISILSTIGGLWQSGARSLAVIAVLFLVTAPLVSGLATLALFLRAAKDRDIDFARRLVQQTRDWAMLDVFALALGIFLVEGNDFVRTELTWGAFLLALLLALYWPASNWYGRRA
ncbi:MAG TPA: paraquat-inducible protein A [Planctomycetota bacterium]|nr:paraquat-inducible protein A [Planctomycetota bacterium]